MKNIEKIKTEFFFKKAIISLFTSNKKRNPIVFSTIWALNVLICRNEQWG